jgi:hypothetical protein
VITQLVVAKKNEFIFDKINMKKAVLKDAIQRTTQIGGSEM